MGRTHLRRINPKQTAGASQEDDPDENITADDVYPRGDCILIEGVSYRLNNFAPYAAFPINEAGQPTRYRFTAYHPNVVVTSRKDRRRIKHLNTSPINTRKTTVAISKMVIKNIEDNQERMHSTIDHYEAVTPPTDQVPEALRHRPNVTTTKDKKGNPNPKNLTYQTLSINPTKRVERT